MNSIPVYTYLQKTPHACPQCESAVRLARNLCLRCLLALGLGGDSDTGETLDDLLGKIALEEAECAASQLPSLEEIEPANYRDNR